MVFSLFTQLDSIELQNLYIHKAIYQVYLIAAY
jgi:hypothetical protein